LSPGGRHIPPTQAAAALSVTDAVPSRFLAYGSIGTGFLQTVNPAEPGSTSVLTQVDAVAYNAEPVQCWFHASMFASGSGAELAFYYDSQSTGEGLGVWFSWRGALPFHGADALQVYATSSGSITWSVLCSGLIVPYDPSLPP
jgi:hypothetical protein